MKLTLSTPSFKTARLTQSGQCRVRQSQRRLAGAEAGRRKRRSCLRPEAGLMKGLGIMMLFEQFDITLVFFSPSLFSISPSYTLGLQFARSWKIPLSFCSSSSGIPLNTALDGMVFAVIYFPIHDNVRIWWLLSIYISFQSDEANTLYSPVPNRVRLEYTYQINAT